MKNEITTVRIDSETNQKLSILKSINGLNDKSELLRIIIDCIFNDEKILTKIGLTKKV